MSALHAPPSPPSLDPNPTPPLRLPYRPVLPILAAITLSIGVLLLPSSSLGRNVGELSLREPTWYDDGLSVKALNPTSPNNVASSSQNGGAGDGVDKFVKEILAKAEHSQGPTEDDQVRLPARPISVTTAHENAGLYAAFSTRIENWVDKLGDRIARLFGLDEAAEAGAENGGLAGWSEGSVYVERTNSLHPTRPSSFGPHITEAPLQSLLFPITTFTTSDSHGCSSLSPSNTTFTPPKKWVALSQRGHCPFSQKVRFAMENGAEAILFGDQSVEDGGIGGIGGGGGGLLTPWSPDDTSDITIPSAFVSRASYISLLKTYDDEQGLAERDDVVGTKAPRGLVIVLSKEELFAWPLLDFLLLLLFLPSLLTLLTVFSHRVRLLRQQKLDRAPRDAVAKLPVFIWGDAEKGTTPIEGAEELPRDEEASVGEPQPTESTSLLQPTTPPRRTLLSRIPFIFLPNPSVQLAPRKYSNRKFLHNLECAICLSDFEKGDKVMELPCGHLFHKEEIEGWLVESKRLCPVCRASITVDTDSPSPTSTPASITASPTPLDLNAPHPDSTVAARPVASSSSVTMESILEQSPHA